MRYIEVKDALEMARIIRSAKFFLGNQTFAFALAEAMKIPRALEVFEPIPNVLPQGKGANDYLTNLALSNILVREKVLEKIEVFNPYAMDFKIYCLEELKLKKLEGTK